MLKSKHFLCQRPVTKPVISLLEDHRLVDFTHSLEGVSGFGEVAA